MLRPRPVKGRRDLLESEPEVGRGLRSPSTSGNDRTCSGRSLSRPTARPTRPRMRRRWPRRRPRDPAVSDAALFSTRSEMPRTAEAVRAHVARAARSTPMASISTARASLKFALMSLYMLDSKLATTFSPAAMGATNASKELLGSKRVTTGSWAEATRRPRRTTRASCSRAYEEMATSGRESSASSSFPVSYPYTLVPTTTSPIWASLRPPAARRTTGGTVGSARPRALLRMLPRHSPLLLRRWRPTDRALRGSRLGIGSPYASLV